MHGGFFAAKALAAGNFLQPGQHQRVGLGRIFRFCVKRPVKKPSDGQTLAHLLELHGEYILSPDIDTDRKYGFTFEHRL